MRGIRPKPWYVHAPAKDPLDHFHLCTHTLDQWLANLRSADTSAFQAAWVDIMGAFRALTDKLPHDDWALRHAPRVAYDQSRDTHCFIFKLDEDSLTFIVTDSPTEGNFLLA